MDYVSFIKIDFELLPKIDGFDCETFKTITWETFGFGEHHQDYTITKNGLLKDKYDNTFLNLNYHGIIKFYSQDVNHKFKAKYTDGKLASIVQIFNEI